MNTQNPCIEEYIEQNHYVQKTVTHLTDAAFLSAYIGANDVLSSLSQCSKFLFQFIFTNFQQTRAYNVTVIDISFRSYKIFCTNTNTKPMVKSSFYRSRTELVKNHIIAESDDTGIFFFNPNFFSNGDRVHVVREYIRNSDIAVSHTNMDSRI